MEIGGNKLARSIYAAKISFDEQLFPGSSQMTTDAFAYKKYVQKAYFNPSAAESFFNMADCSEDKLSLFKYKGLKPYKVDAWTVCSDFGCDDVRYDQDEQKCPGFGEEATGTGISKPGIERSGRVQRATMDTQERLSRRLNHQANGMIVKTSCCLARTEDAMYINREFEFDDFLECDDSHGLQWWSDFVEESILDDNGFFTFSAAANAFAPLQDDNKRSTVSSRIRGDSVQRTGGGSSATCCTHRRGPARRRGSWGGDVVLPHPNETLGCSLHQVSNRGSEIAQIGGSARTTKVLPLRSSEAGLSEGQYRRRRGSMNISNEIPHRRSDSSLNGMNRRRRGSIDTSNAHWQCDSEASFEGRRFPMGRDFFKERESKAFDSTTHCFDRLQQRRRTSRGTSVSSGSSDLASSRDFESETRRPTRRRSNSASSIHQRDAPSTIEPRRKARSSGGDPLMLRGNARGCMSSHSRLPTNMSLRRSNSSTSLSSEFSTPTTSRPSRRKGQYEQGTIRRNRSQNSLTDKLEQLTSSSRHRGDSSRTCATIA
jgi:hypothetical protein